MECKVKEFNSDEEAIKYGQNENGDFYTKGFAWEKIRIKDEDIILCKDCREYLDEAEGFFIEMCSKFKMNKDTSDCRWDLVYLLQDLFKVRFLDVYDEF